VINKYFKLAVLLPVGIAMVACIGSNAGSSGSAGAPAATSPVSAAAPAAPSVVAPAPEVSAATTTDSTVPGSTPANTTLADSATANPTNADSLAANSSADAAATDSLIGVISWNVKGDTRQKVNGGWNVVTPDGGNQGKEISFIKSQIASGKPVDFINLVQTTENNGNNHTQLDKVLGATKWGGIYSDCFIDATQIIYDKTKWAPASSNFPNGGFKGCKPDPWDDRPYSMAMFKNVNPTAKKVLFISVHFPHIPMDASWTQMGSFKTSVTTLINSNGGARNVRVIMAGDMNEVGENFYAMATKDFINTFQGGDATIKGALSAEERSCCGNNGYVNRFDKVYATNSTITQTLMDTSSYGITEEHRPIYVQVGALSTTEEPKQDSEKLKIQVDSK